MIRLIRKILGDNRVTYRIARTPEDIETVRNLRYRVFGPEEAHPPYIFSRDDVVDDYDSVAVNLLAERDGEPAGSLRITDQRQLSGLKYTDGVARDDNGNVIFPIERDMPDIGDKIKERYIDGRNVIIIDRLVVPKEFSGNGIATGLYSSSYSYVKKTNINDAFMIINCEMHSRGRNDIPEDKRVKIPNAYLSMGFSPIDDIFWYDDFNAYAAVMHLPDEQVTKKLKLLTAIRKLNGRIVDFDECPERMPDMDVGTVFTYSAKA